MKRSHNIKTWRYCSSWFDTTFLCPIPLFLLLRDPESLTNIGPILILSSDTLHRSTGCKDITWQLRHFQPLRLYFNLKAHKSAEHVSLSCDRKHEHEHKRLHVHMERCVWMCSRVGTKTWTEICGHVEVFLGPFLGIFEGCVQNQCSSFYMFDLQLWSGIAVSFFF